MIIIEGAGGQEAWVIQIPKINFCFGFGPKNVHVSIGMDLFSWYKPFN